VSWKPETDYFFFGLRHEMNINDIEGGDSQGHLHSFETRIEAKLVNVSCVTRGLQKMEKNY
jgi:hypothetical protein